ncbi:hypothetical protein BJ508DRAFT_322010 [Ascobolus immersus RN42]|uniref:AMP-activated protein kinase glycogen-binding domain-containing protein n=1 Tax=Ascobolus immersus RN42 TaxID=1160509 RepID=A0A3N4IQ62_ASCIM|nr:hypothetical protein BJ508DRAFT_322010 [Ascobolus immersus RN42]
MASTAQLVSHTFKWKKRANIHEVVIVTGSFDAWAKTLQLLSDPEDSHQLVATTRLPEGETVPYKFIVNGIWMIDPTSPTQYDSDHNLNNIITVPIAPTIELEWPNHIRVTVNFERLSQCFNIGNTMEIEQKIARVGLLMSVLEAVYPREEFMIHDSSGCKMGPNTASVPHDINTTSPLLDSCSKGLTRTRDLKSVKRDFRVKVFWNVLYCILQVLRLAAIAGGLYCWNIGLLKETSKTKEHNNKGSISGEATTELRHMASFNTLPVELHLDIAEHVHPFSLPALCLAKPELNRLYQPILLKTIPKFLASKLLISPDASYWDFPSCSLRAVGQFCKFACKVICKLTSAEVPLHIMELVFQELERLLVENGRSFGCDWVPNGDDDGVDAGAGSGAKKHMWSSFSILREMFERLVTIGQTKEDLRKFRFLLKYIGSEEYQENWTSHCKHWIEMMETDGGDGKVSAPAIWERLRKDIWPQRTPHHWKAMMKEAKLATEYARGVSYD